jgi:hypothetical protein
MYRIDGTINFANGDERQINSDVPRTESELSEFIFGKLLDSANVTSLAISIVKVSS